MSRNISASVHQRLLNRAKAESRPFNELLQHFVLERFLFRLGNSAYASRFVLKGALMFRIWHGSLSRATRDVDLLGYHDHSVERIVEIVQAICSEPVAEDDGLRFGATRGERITEAADYAGGRAHLIATLGQARIPFLVDVGFGDPIVPGPTRVYLPTILDFPAPDLLGYSRESVVAEKFHAMVYLGEINSRLKDFYDVWVLANQTTFDGILLAEAVAATFAYRHTAIQPTPVALSTSFSGRADKQAQWRAFVRRHPVIQAPETLDDLVQVLAPFLSPITSALVDDRPFEQHWSPGGPWREGRLIGGADAASG